MTGEQISGLLAQFVLDEVYDTYDLPTEVTEGHINTTYIITAKNASAAKRYLLQRINTFVFKNPRQLMENITGVTGYIADRLCETGGGMQTLKCYPTHKGDYFHCDDENGCWRVYNYVEGSYCLQAAQSTADAYKAGLAFGSFLRLLDGYPSASLHETIPDFHNTKARYAQLQKAIADNAVNRLEEVQPEVAFAAAREADCSKVLDLLAAGKLPLRVTHNDTKLNNVLFDKATREPICVVDLDTIMPGLSLYDFGDSLRFMGNTAAEDERDLGKVSFDMDVFKAFAEGYLSGAGDAITDAEKALLPFSVKLLTLECGMRFLADYLNGDVYFRIHKEDDNLARCRTQFKLVQCIETLLPEMEAVIAAQ
jgi:Ser/Thr protein kinase RdoA (MazF antagonist)